MVAAFIGVVRSGLPVRPRSLSSLGFALGVVGFSFVFAGFIGVRPSGRLVYQGSLGSLGCVQVIVAFTRFSACIGVRPKFSTSSGVAGFIGVRPGGRQVHPG